MNKLFTFLAGAALAGSFTACSSDEPSKGPEQGNPEANSSMYLAVKITSADRTVGRAGTDFEDNNNPIEGTYEPGDEHEVKSAQFFFFNSQGIYVTQGEKWSGDTISSDKNIELESKTIVALKGLEKVNLPKYVITVLNAPANIAKEMKVGTSTMEDLQKKEMTYLSNLIDNDKSKNYFVMSTSSFYSNKEQSKFYDNKYPYANRIPDGYLVEEEPDKPIQPVNVLDIYVERLAAKYSLDAAKKEFEISLSLAGSGNVSGEDSDDEVNAAATTIAVKITGLGVTNTEPMSYLLKDISGFDASGIMNGSGNWDTWNNPTDRRCFWGKSMGYNSPDASNFIAAKYADGVYKDETKPTAAYSNETTKALSLIQGTDKSLRSDRLPVFYLTAETTVKGEKHTLVQYDGMFFYEEQFKKFHLMRTANSSSDKLNFWIRVKETQETTPSDKGNIIANGYEYRQVGPDDITFVRKGPTVKNSTVKLIYNAGKTLYKYDAEANPGSKFTAYTSGGADKLNEALESLFKNVNDNYPEYYNGGVMYYTIPVEHLLGTNKSVPNITAEKEGEYGTVRNHWYQLSVNKIVRMGHGVFDPSDGEDGDIIYPEENPNSKTYGMAASIKILSWKIVKQTVDL